MDRCRCPWRDRCKGEWEAADHLSLVANIRSTQREKLVAAGMTTVTELAALPAGQRVPGMNPDILNRLRTQARLQVVVRGTDEHRHELLSPGVGKGFSRMPRPADVDLFFDMEGDPLYPGGLEYLSGVHVGDPEAGTFMAFWGHDRAGEKKALEDFLDFVSAHLAVHPDAHIYHYNHYEVTAVRRLAMAHATREAVVDDLLRRNKFIDLLKVVREGLLVSEPRYSLKNIEHFYMPKRAGDVATAADSIVAYERWRAVGEQRILDDIEFYNAVDCRSTALLRDWLLSIRPSGTDWFDPADVAPDAEALARQAEAEAERLAIEARLLTGVSEEDRPFRQLVADLVEFHRREAKPGWWALFDRRDRDEDELIDDTECLGGLSLVGAPEKDSHKAINNLLAGIEKAAKASGFNFSGVKKSSDGDNAFGGEMVKDVYDNAEVVPGTPLIAGTAWLFARPEFEQCLDYLFIDEASQVALGNLVAMGTAARNIVLVGDQQQLGQPVQGVHPGESGANVLDHLLRGAATVQPDRGIFLDVSWRMHPAVCDWISEAIYEGRLHSHPSTARQSLILGGAAYPALAPTGLRFLAVAHAGRGQQCPEEAATVKAIWHDLMGRRWCDSHGVERPIGPEDVLVVAPYNVQVNTIRDVLPPDARVGTVDKFQGQEAAVAIVSMTTSSGDDLPRDIEFLFSRNRLNVAVSRARCLAIVLASPRLLEVSCASVADMRLVDTLCHAYEWSTNGCPTRAVAAP